MKLISALAATATLTSLTLAGSNIDSNNKFAWSENAGWINLRDPGDSLNGIHVRDTYLAGYAWAENFGMINFGNVPENEFEYANEETKKGPQVGLAYIADETTLEQASGNLLIATTNTVVTYGNPSDDIFGKIESQTIESSNVELATEFGNMIRTQRAYQGCSRIMNVVDEMLQDLLRGR